MSGERRCHIVVLGNEKGGTGKSTTAMHLIAALLHEGHSVGAIDLDTRQGSLSRYLANRLAYGERFGVPLLHPETGAFQASPLSDRHAAEAADVSALNDALAALGHCDYVVVDTPGSSEPISRAGHARADTLISPMNDSFVDLDLLADVDPESFRVLRPSRYAEMVWEMRKMRALRDRGTIDWIVMRNRLASLESRNMRRMDDVLRALSSRVGFRLAPGFGERVIFRELFLKGLTLLDLKEGGYELTLSHVAARNEVRGLLRAIGLGRFPDRTAPAVPLAAEAPERTLWGYNQAGGRAKRMSDKDDKLPTKTSSSAEVDAFLRQVAATATPKEAGERGRLLFAIDATASREPTWDMACHIQAEMFAETAALGGLEIQLAFYRGFGEFKVSPWLTSSAELIRRMTKVSCLAGRTQIRKLLRHALRETQKRKIDAVVFVGDVVEEDIDDLGHRAGELGLQGTPVFIFHEGHEPTSRRAFEQIAKLTRGAVCQFDAGSAKQLRDLLTAVAVFSAGGRRALEDYGRKTGGKVLQLTHQING